MRGYRRKMASIAGLVALTVAVSLASKTAFGVDFRVENQVFSGGGKTPQVQSKTIFLDGVVYDYLEHPKEITVFDVANGRFICLDPKRHVRTELATEHLESLAMRLKDWAANQPDGFLKFLADPKFEKSLDENTGERIFDSPWMTYRVTAVRTSNPGIASQYAAFSDWYGRLNTRINPGSRPPFARMIVNAELDREQLFPEKVHLTLRPNAGGLLAKKTTLRSEHKLVRQLVESDRRQVAQTDQYLAIFQPLSFREYQQGMHQE
jgi:hypothetical protein